MKVILRFYVEKEKKVCSFTILKMVKIFAYANIYQNPNADAFINLEC
jgi:hypothetical protein